MQNALVYYSKVSTKNVYESELRRSFAEKKSSWGKKINGSNLNLPFKSLPTSQAWAYASIDPYDTVL